nr:hypothetical protein [Acetivibrio clariflavus]
MREIYRTVRKRRGRSKYLASVMVELHDKEGNHIPAKNWSLSVTEETRVNG